MKFGSGLIKPLVGLILLSVATISSATEDGDDNYFNVSVGVSSGVSSIFVYERTTIDQEEAAILQGEVITPVLRIATKNLASSSGRLTVTIEGGYSQFSTDMQDDHGVIRDFGTSADAKYLYIMPIIGFHSGAGKTSDPAKMSGLVLQAGFGFTHMSVEGNYVDTRPSHFTGEKESFSYSGVATLLKLYLGYQLNNLEFGINIIAGGDEANDPSTENSYVITDGGLELVYKMYL